MFFDAGFIILIPIVFAFSKVAGLNPIKFGLPVAGIMLAVHVAVPPHPGIVGGSAILGADIGWVTIFALAISVPLAVLSYLVAKWINTREFAMLAATKEMYDNFGTEKSTLTGGLGEGEKAPGAGTVLGLILLPLVLIMLGTAVAPLFEAGTFWNGFLSMVGQPIFALMVAIAAAMYLLGVRRGWSAAHLGEVMESALPAAAVIILVTGAGGAFGRVLTETGIGSAVAEVLASSGCPCCSRPSSSRSSCVRLRVGHRRDRDDRGPPPALGLRDGTRHRAHRTARGRHRVRRPRPQPRERLRLLGGHAVPGSLGQGRPAHVDASDDGARGLRIRADLGAVRGDPGLLTALARTAVTSGWRPSVVLGRW